MNILSKIISAPIKAAKTAVGITNIITEKAIGCDLDILELEDKLQDLADEIDDYD